MPMSDAAALFTTSLIDDLRHRAGQDFALLPFLAPLIKGLRDGFPDQAVEVIAPPAVDFETVSKNITAAPEMRQALLELSGELSWKPVVAASDQVDPALSNGMYAAHIYGAIGVLGSDILRGGLFLLAPNIHYPLHTHVPTELYYCLSGTVMVQHGVDGEAMPLTAGNYSITPTGRTHSLTTGDEPVLLYFSWVGDFNHPIWWWEQGADAAWSRAKWSRAPDGVWTRGNSEPVDSDLLAEQRFNQGGNSMTDSAAETLAEMRLNGTKMDTEPGSPPATAADAYAVQDAMVAAMNLPIAGWKVGATNEGAQQKLGTDSPFYGPMFDRWIYEAPTRIPMPADSLKIVEIEVGFRLSADLPARDAAYSADEIADAIEAAYPAIEIVDRRIAGPFGGHVNWLIADCGANHAFVYGKPVKNWRDIDFSTMAVSVSVDDVEVATGTGAMAMGGAFKSMTWFVEAMRANGKGLKAGDWVSTGTLIQPFPGTTGSKIVGTLDGFGTIEAVLI